MSQQPSIIYTAFLSAQQSLFAYNRESISETLIDDSARLEPALLAGFA
jgi:hypothetical protein